MLALPALHELCPPTVLFPCRLEYPARGVLPADNQQTAEGGLPHVRHLRSRFPLHPQCLPRCHGATGIIRGDARYVLANYGNASETLLLSHFTLRHSNFGISVKTLTSVAVCGRK